LLVGFGFGPQARALLTKTVTFFFFFFLFSFHFFFFNSWIVLLACSGTEIIGPPREALRWRVDQIVSSSALGPAVTAEVEMQFSNGVAVAMTAAEFRELHASLRAAKGIMDDI
jgi:hypothetical protein